MKTEIVEITFYPSWIGRRRNNHYAAKDITTAREFVSKFGCRIDLPTLEEDGFSTAPIITDLCGNTVQVGMVQAI